MCSKCVRTCVCLHSGSGGGGGGGVVEGEGVEADNSPNGRGFHGSN